MRKLFAFTLIALVFSRSSPAQTSHVPFGCYPVKLLTQREANGWLLTLDGTAPSVSYLILIRTNKLFGCWHHLASAVGKQNARSTTIRLPLRSLPAYAILAAGSGEDADGDMLPDIYEDLVTRTDPLDGATGDGGEDGYADPDGDGWNNMQEFQNDTCPGPMIQTVPNSCDAEGIRKTIRRVICVQTNNGFILKVEDARVGAHYLMLVREGTNGFWKAAGFFTGAANGTILQANKIGMLLPTGCPLVLPHVQFIPALVHPEFLAGSGEDVDGDGLPDIYEVLATKTQPDNADTGSTGLLDGYKDLAGDDWTALEKYRRRCDPFTPDRPPAPIELTEPTQVQLMKVLWQAQQHDFRYRVKLEARKLNPRSEYQVLQENSAPLFPPLKRDMPAANLQIRITVEMPEKIARPHHVGGP